MKSNKTKSQSKQSSSKVSENTKDWKVSKTKETKQAQELLSLSDEETSKFIKFAKIAGITLGTAAACYAGYYMYQNRKTLGKDLITIMSRPSLVPNSILQRLDSRGLNRVYSTTTNTIDELNAMPQTSIGDKAKYMGYHASTCTHEWIFKIHNNDDGSRTLFMADGWDGRVFNIGDMSLNGSFEKNGGYLDFMNEMGHYNKESLRFYAPELKDVNLEKIKNVILQKN